MLCQQITHEFFLIKSFLTIIFLSLVVFGQNTPNDETCKSLDDQPIERQMSGAETHCYRIDLQKGQFLQVKVEQKGLDVALKFYDSKNELITEIDSPNGTKGFEVLPLVASETGVYKLEISSSEVDTPKGDYVILRDALRIATEQDRQKFEAQQAFAQGKNSTSPPDALKLFQKAAELFQKVNDKKGSADSFTEVGFTAISLGNGSVALIGFEKALMLYKEISDRRETAKTIKYIGYVYFLSGNSAKALENYEEAVPLFHSSDIEDKADTLEAIGNIYSRMSIYSKALENYQQALPLFRSVLSVKGESDTLNNIGVVYLELGQKQKALETFTQQLDFLRKNKLKQNEVVVLNNIGRAFDELGNKEKALENFNLALSTVENKQGKASILLSIGKVYLDSGDKQKAFESFNQSLEIFKEIGDKFGESAVTNAIGRYFSNQNDKQKALEYYNLALKLQKSFGFQNGEAKTFANLMATWQSLNNRRLAIFYGKQSINVFQQIRADIQNLEGESQRAFIKSVENVYRNLAALLIDEERIEEAQEVLSLLKGEEFYQYTRRSSDNVPDAIRQLELNAEETETATKAKELNDKFMAASKQIFKLEDEKLKQTLTPEKEAELQKLQNVSAEFNAGYDKFLQNLAVKFSQPVKIKPAELSNSQTKMWQKKLAGFGQETVLLTTLVAGDKYYVIITTPTTQIARKSDLKQADLNEKIGNLREILENPRTNPMAATQELYQILVKPVEADLTQLNAKTLLWSLDGALRYVPFAALHDGKKYLVEKYTNAIVTLAQPPQDFSDSPTKWRALGAGVSTGNGELKPLPNVPSALKTIVRDESAKDQKAETGIFAGKRLLDKDFTRLNLTNALNQKFQLVHFATHFVFNRGKDVDSFLLLGGGDKLNLAELRTNKLFDFTGVDLLTLSACETARAGLDADGVEIESFGVITQKRGAKTVLATLWSIADNATPELMEEFYRQYQAGNGLISKAEALRQAQITLLKKRKTNKNFTHPAYWSPFIVLGEWR